MLVLGFGGWHHDANVALLRAGGVVGVGEEERFTRVRYQGAPHLHSLRFCLDAERVSLDEINYVTFYMERDAESVKSFKKLYSELDRKLVCVDHHASHAASAFFTSPFEEAAVLTIDGYGDGYSTCIWHGKGTTVKPLVRIPTPTSVGTLWMAITQFLGFGMRDEGKTMALASYGRPTLVDFLMERIILRGGGAFEFDFTKNQRSSFFDSRKSFFIPLAGVPRQKEEPFRQIHFDIAASLQSVTNILGLHLADAAFHATGLPNLCVAGGVALNSVLNGVLLKESPFTAVHVPPFPGDNGTGLGSALYLYHHILGNPRTDFQIESALLGKASTIEQIARELTKFGVTATDSRPTWKGMSGRGALPAGSPRFRSYESPQVTEDVARYLAEGAIVGWFQGRAECGPRALGNRSILADPQNGKVKDFINKEVKHREWFRPLAPSVLQQDCAEYFDSAHPSPYMSFVYQVRDGKRAAIPAVTHIDSSARVQTVARTQNERYYRLLQSFKEITGIPVLLNTSFNNNEPIVNSPEDAMRCFAQTPIDVLVLEDYIVVKT